MDQERYQDEPFDESNTLLGKEGALPLNNPKELRKRKGHSKLKVFMFFVLFGTLHWLFLDLAIYAYRGPASRRPHGAGGQVEFEDITPSEKLQWHPCRGTFFCARLTVPMDYNRPLNASSDNPKVHVALLLAPGKHSTPNEYSVSPLLINPGGPGGSGTMAAMGLSDDLQHIIGQDQDVIGFDPRGVGATTPRVDCFATPYQNANPYDFGAMDFFEGFYKRVTWIMAGTQIGLINSSSVALEKLDVRARTISKLCQEKDTLQGNNSMFKHLHTPNVARDMISIIDAWDEWRESLQSTHTSDEPAGSRHESLEFKHSPTTKGNLVYWGFSYGTLLGATFSAMFPDRVGRVVLDGVVDAALYVEPIWSKSIVDADHIFDSFPKYCFEGKEKCQLYRPGDSHDDVKSRFDDAQSNLRSQPFSFVGPTTHQPFILNIDDVRMLFFSSLYAPTYMFSVIAMLIDAFIREDLYTLEFFFHLPPKEVFAYPQAESSYPNDAQMSIMCGDKRHPLNETTTQIQKRFEEMSKLSSFADVWLSVMTGCDGWSIDTIDPPMRWGKHPAHKDKPINTSFPLLFLSNTYDPVTPLSAGVKMAKLFADAGLLEQKSMGHCSLSSVSLCTAKVVRAYFQDGKVPAPPVTGRHLSDGEWEKCEADEWPFHPYEGPRLESIETKEDEGLRAAAKGMQKVARDYGFFRLDHGRHMSHVQGQSWQTWGPVL